MPILQLAGLIPEVFDPFADAVEAFLPMREFAQNIKKNFLGQAKFFENRANEMKELGKANGDSELQGRGSELKKQALLRGSIGALTNYVASVGMISEDERKASIARLKDFSKAGDQAKVR